MADSYPSLTDGTIPQHRDHVIPMPSYPQNYDFSPGHNDLHYLTQHYAFAPQSQQTLSIEESSHPQHAHYANSLSMSGFSVASYMGYPNALFHHGPSGARAVSTLILTSCRPSTIIHVRTAVPSERAAYA